MGCLPPALFYEEHFRPPFCVRFPGFFKKSFFTALGSTREQNNATAGRRVPVLRIPKTQGASNQHKRGRWLLLARCRVCEWSRGAPVSTVRCATSAACRRMITTRVIPSRAFVQSLHIISHPRPKAMTRPKVRCEGSRTSKSATMRARQLDEAERRVRRLHVQQVAAVAAAAQSSFC